jgi:hypothetical protein
MLLDRSIEETPEFTGGFRLSGNSPNLATLV